MTKTLSETRKADREQMAVILIEKCTEAGAVAYRNDINNNNNPRVKIEASGGLDCTIKFDGDSCQPNVFVSPWHIRFRCNSKLNHHAFGFDTVNPYHQRKSTLVAHGFDELVEQTMRVITRCVTGEAFEFVDQDCP